MWFIIFFLISDFMSIWTCQTSNPSAKGKYPFWFFMVILWLLYRILCKWCIYQVWFLDTWSIISPPIVGVVGVASCPSAVSMARKSRDHDHGFNWLLNLDCWLLSVGSWHSTSTSSSIFNSPMDLDAAAFIVVSLGCSRRVPLPLPCHSVCFLFKRF